jgi:hypothetical protein
MPHRKLVLPLLLATVSWASTARATAVFTLSSPSDLSALTVGQVVEIDLSLSGLPSPNNQTDFIFNLNTKILFDSSLFQAVPDPTSLSGLTAVVAPGSVFDNNVQGPLQIANFNYQGAKPDGLPDSSLTSGAATGIFSQYPNTNSGAIGLNGLYYSFMLKAVAAGTGSISFDPAAGANEYAANETGFNYAPLVTNGNLSFNIAQAAVPEPSSIALLAIGVATLGYRTHARRNAAAV